MVTVGGDLVLYVERGGRTLLSFTDDADTLAAAGKALADAVHSGALGAISVERADGEAVHSAPLRDALTAAGFRVTRAAYACAADLHSPATARTCPTATARTHPAPWALIADA